MKKRIAYTAFALVACLGAAAQQENKKGSIELTIGAAIPISKYANGETGRHISGFTKTGQALTLSYFHPTKKKLGFMATVIGQWNPLNTAALEDSYSNLPFYTFTASSGPPPNPAPVYYKNWEFDKESWLTISLMGGAYTILPLNAEGNLSFTMKAAIGAAYASSPQYSGISDSDTTVVRVLQQKNDAFGFSYSFTPGLMYEINPGIHLNFNFGYFGTAAMSFDNMKTSGRIESGDVLTGTVSSWTMTSDVGQSVQTINLAIGIQFDL